MKICGALRCVDTALPKARKACIALALDPETRSKPRGGKAFNGRRRWESGRASRALEAMRWQREKKLWTGCWTLGVTVLPNVYGEEEGFFHIMLVVHLGSASTAKAMVATRQAPNGLRTRGYLQSQAASCQ